MPFTEIHVRLTAGHFLLGFVALVLLVAVAFLAGAWAMRPERDVAAVPSVDPPESAETVPLPRGHVGGPRTGTLHGPVHRPDVEDMPTAFIEAVRR